MRWVFEQNQRLKERVKGGLCALGAWEWGDEGTQAAGPLGPLEPQRVCQWLQLLGKVGWLSPGMCVAVPTLPSQAAELVAPDGVR